MFNQISCCSSNCPRCMTCQKFFNEGYTENYYSYGAGSIDANGVFINDRCGELGHWAMYEERKNT